MKPKNPLRLLLSLACGAGLSITSASAANFLIDFGMSGSNPSQHGSPTTSPDINGNHWNNLTSTNYANVVQPGGAGSTSLSSLVNTVGDSSTIGITLASGSVVWRSSGIINGGLNQNMPALGNLGIQTATQDYYFIEGGNGVNATITLTGLNPLHTYDFGLFGTRGDTNDVRTTSYIVTDINGPSAPKNVQTSGPGIGINGGFVNNNGNDSTVVTFAGLVPNGSGELVLTVSVVNGGFAYLGAMEITEVIPEPGSALLAGLGGLMLLSRRSRNAR